MLYRKFYTTLAKFGFKRFLQRKILKKNGYSLRPPVTNPPFGDKEMEFSLEPDPNRCLHLAHFMLCTQYGFSSIPNSIDPFLNLAINLSKSWHPEKRRKEATACKYPHFVHLAASSRKSPTQTQNGKGQQLAVKIAESEEERTDGRPPEAFANAYAVTHRAAPLPVPSRPVSAARNAPHDPSKKIQREKNKKSLYCCYVRRWQDPSQKRQQTGSLIALVRSYTSNTIFVFKITS
jgi:hypothetical protein